MSVKNLLITFLTISMVLLTLRLWITNSFDYGFLAYNLALAAIPLYFATSISTTNRTNSKVIRYLTVFAWFIFYPNAPYIFTDFIHLNKSYDVNFLIYDFLLILTFSLAGILLGFESLILIYKTVIKPYVKIKEIYFYTIISIFTGIGLYLGRVKRLNSWEIVVDPMKVFEKTLYSTLLSNDNIKNLLIITSFAILHQIFFTIWLKVRQKL